MWESLREATDEEMERDATVCVMGKLVQQHYKCPFRSIACQPATLILQVRMLATMEAATRSHMVYTRSMVTCVCWTHLSAVSWASIAAVGYCSSDLQVATVHWRYCCAHKATRVHRDIVWQTEGL